MEYHGDNNYITKIFPLLTIPASHRRQEKTVVLWTKGILRISLLVKNNVIVAMPLVLALINEHQSEIIQLGLHPDSTP